MKSASFDKACPRTRAARLTPEARRAQLLASAMRVFARRGIGAARHAELASEAGVAVSTTFAYFPTREDLVAAVLDAVERLYVELAESVHASDRPAPELLLAHVRAFATLVDERPDEARVWLNWSSAVGGDVWPRYRAFEERVGSVLARTIARGQREGSLEDKLAPEEGARIMIGAAYLIAQMKLSGRPEQQVAPFLVALVRVLAGGLVSGAVA
jgi:TetR/AcrR family hemagglutinin/protease transcriptional regulator